MIRTTATPRPVRVGAALVGVAGLTLLAGCSAGTAVAESDQSTTETSASTPSATTEATTGDTASGDSTYVDGTYTASGSYATPESVEEISVTLTIADDVVTAVEVTGNPTKRESEQYQSQFIGGISEVVVGQDLDEVSVSRVAGSSLTSGGFTQALEEIKSEAAA